MDFRPSKGPSSEAGRRIGSAPSFAPPADAAAQGHRPLAFSLRRLGRPRRRPRRRWPASRLRLGQHRPWPAAFRAVVELVRLHDKA